MDSYADSCFAYVYSVCLLNNYGGMKFENIFK